MFKNPRSLLLLFLLIPVYAVILANYRSGKAGLKKLGGAWRESFLLNVFIVKYFFHSFLFICAAAFTIIAIASPIWGSRPEPYNPGGLDIVLALDISRSMKAQDSSPSRLARSKTIIQGLVEGLPNDRYALVLIKGDGVLAIPPTEDKAALYTMMERIEPEYYTAKSTNLQTGLETALKSFPGGTATRKVIILFSDGDSLYGNPGETAREAADNGIVIYTVGAGTEEGSEIPAGPGTVIKGSSGNAVISSLNRALLEEIARVTGGKYFSLNDPLILGKLMDSVSDDYHAVVRKGFLLERRERYRIFLSLAIICLFGMVIVRTFAWRKTL